MKPNANPFPVTMSLLLIALISIWPSIFLVACSSGTTPNSSNGQTSAEKDFEETVFAAEDKVSAFIRAANSLTSSSTSQYGNELSFFAGEVDNLLTWFNSMESAFQNVYSQSLTVQASTPVTQDDFDNIFGSINGAVEDFQEKTFGDRDKLKEFINGCIAAEWKTPICAELREDVTKFFNETAIAVVDLANKATSSAVSFLFGESSAQPGEPTALKIKDDTINDTAASVLWSFCNDLQAEGKKCHLASVTGTTEEELPVPFLPPNADKIKLVIQIEGKAPIIVETNLEDGKVTIINTSSPDNPEITTEEPQLVSCDQINALNLEVSPPNPSPGQSVFVRAFTIPPAEDCKIDYRVVGTDLFTDSGTLTTSSRGSVGIRIEGADELISDYVEFTAENGVSASAAYTFE